MNKIKNSSALIFLLVVSIGLGLGFAYSITPEATAYKYCVDAETCSENNQVEVNECSEPEDCCTDARAGCEDDESAFWIGNARICLEDEPGDPSGGGSTDPQPTPAPTNNNGTGNTNIGPPYEGGPQTIMEVIESITDWVLGIAGALAVLFIIISGIRYITSAGNQNLQEAAKKNLTSAIIGLVIVLLAFVIVQVLARVLTS